MQRCWYTVILYIYSLESGHLVIYMLEFFTQITYTTNQQVHVFTLVAILTVEIKIC